MAITSEMYPRWFSQQNDPGSWIWETNVQSMNIWYILYLYYSILYDSCYPAAILRKLQEVQNASNCILTRKRKEVARVLFKLKWLPIKSHFDNNVLLMTFAALKSSVPVYLAHLFKHYSPLYSDISWPTVIPKVTLFKSKCSFCY